MQIFKIYKGGEQFFQWDLGQRLVVEDADCNRVHFCNMTDDCSLVCHVYEEDGVKLVNVPNVLLQSTNMVRAFACVAEDDDTYYAKDVQSFKVYERRKPEDYAYTEEEIKNYDALDTRVTKLEEDIKNAGGGMKEVGSVTLSFSGVFEDDGEHYMPVFTLAGTQFPIPAYAEEHMTNYAVLYCDDAGATFGNKELAEQLVNLFKSSKIIETYTYIDYADTRNGEDTQFSNFYDRTPYTHVEYWCQDQVIEIAGKEENYYVVYADWDNGEYEDYVNDDVGGDYGIFLHLPISIIEEVWSQISGGGESSGIITIKGYN